MTQGPQHTRPRKDGVSNLLLFPDDSAASPATLSPTNASSIRESSHPPPSIALITAEWQTLAKRLGRQRCVLETILAAGHPLQIAGNTLVVGFSPRRRFHRELLDMPEYRSCVEQELLRTFRVRLWVITTLYPEGHPAVPRSLREDPSRNGERPL
jgi:hypothetical protein